VKAGEELDILIAHHIMGAVWVQEDEEQPEACPYLQGNNWVFYPSIGPKLYGNTTYTGGMPNYSGQIEHAWAVVEKMRELNFIFTLESCFNGFNVGFDEYNNGLCGNIGGDTAPEAICLASLKAMGVSCE